MQTRRSIYHKLLLVSRYLYLFKDVYSMKNYTNVNGDAQRRREMKSEDKEVGTLPLNFWKQRQSHSSNSGTKGD